MCVVVWRVCWPSTCACPTPDSALLNPSNGHYYEYTEATDPAMMDGVWSSRSGLVVSAQHYFGHLLTITSQDELDFVHNTLGVRADAWLALSDSSSEGVWRWIDGPEAGMELSWANWLTNEPDGGTGENCACSSGQGLWFDVPCASTYYRVIEYEPQSAHAGIRLFIT